MKNIFDLIINLYIILCSFIQRYVEWILTDLKYFDNFLGLQANEQACCRALTAECMSCAAGMSISEYCEINIDAVGCEG